MKLNAFRRRTRIIAVAAALTIGLAGCGSGGTAAPSAAPAVEIQSGGIVTVAANGEMAGFDPLKLLNVGTGLERAALVMDTLMYRDEATDEVHPKLAQSMTSEDGQTWILTLREDVNFTDGTPLDAEAVIFNLERHLAPDSASAAKALLSVIETMEASGPLEVTFTLKAPSGSFPLTFTAVTPAGVIGSPTALADPVAFNSMPVGAGPFMVESWTRDDKLVLVKNEDYWDEGKPHVDGATFVVVPDPQTRADGLASGGYDLAQLVPSAWASTDTTPGLTLLPVQTGGTALVPNASQAPGNDQRVREAIFLAFDPETSLNVIFGGSQYFSDTNVCAPFPSGSGACNREASFTQDIDRAKELVADYVADGNPAPTFELVYFQTQTDQVSYAQSVLKVVGIETTLRSVDAAGLSEAQATGDYGLFWGATATAGYPTVFTRYYSGATNWGRVTYPELDEALFAARDGLTLDARNAGWQDATQFIYDNAILDWIIPYAAAMAHRDTLHLGSEERPYSGSPMVYLDDAWLSE